MRNKMILTSMMLIFAMLFAACGSTEEVAPVVKEADVAVEEAVADDAVTPTEAAVEMPTEAVEAAIEEADLDTAFQIFLDDMEAYNTISPDLLYGMTAGGGDVFVLDVRSPSELVEKGWIEGAVNVPLRELADSTEYLPSEEMTIVTYCGTGWRCTIALTALEAMGWDDVRGLKGGSYGGWVDAGYPIGAGTVPELVELNAFEPETAVVAEIQTMLQNIPDDYGVITADALEAEIADNPDLILIDVRKPGEIIEKGYIDAENVLFIPLEEFIANADQWPDMDAPIVTYCGSGHRSTIAMSILWANDYTDVRSLKGGYGGWAGGEHPTVGAAEVETAVFNLNDNFQIFLDDMEAYNTISPDLLYGMTAGSNDVFILDVRKPNELTEKGWIENAVNIPLFELADSTAYLPSFDTPIVSYCGTGWRCTIALTTLEAMGWEDVKGLKGGSYGGWVEAGYPISAGVAPERTALNEADVSDDLLLAAQSLLDSVPDGYGVITADDLLLEQTENPDLILIDVRKESELEEKGIIDHNPDLWINLPLEEFVADISLWPEDLDAPIVVHCGSGHRSTIAMTILWANGYSNVRSLKGGFSGWVDAGHSVMEYVMP